MRKPKKSELKPNGTLIEQINLFKKSNGYVIDTKGFDEGIVYQENDETEKTEYEAFVNIMFKLREILEPSEATSRYAERSLYLITAPRDKYDFNPDVDNSEYIKDLEGHVEYLQHCIQTLKGKI